MMVDHSSVSSTEPSTPSTEKTMALTYQNRVVVTDSWAIQQADKRFITGYNSTLNLCSAFASEGCCGYWDNTPDCGTNCTSVQSLTLSDDFEYFKDKNGQDTHMRTGHGQAFIVSGNSCFPLERMNDFFTLSGNNASKHGNAQYGEGSKLMLYAIIRESGSALQITADFSKGEGMLQLFSLQPSQDSQGALSDDVVPEHKVAKTMCWFDTSDVATGPKWILLHERPSKGHKATTESTFDYDMILRLGPHAVYKDVDGEMVHDRSASENALQDLILRCALNDLFDNFRGGHTYNTGHYNALVITKMPYVTTLEGGQERLVPPFAWTGGDKPDIMCRRSYALLSVEIGRQWPVLSRDSLYIGDPEHGGELSHNMRDIFIGNHFAHEVAAPARDKCLVLHAAVAAHMRLSEDTPTMPFKEITIAWPEAELGRMPCFDEETGYSLVFRLAASPHATNVDDIVNKKVSEPKDNQKHVHMREAQTGRMLCGISGHMNMRRLGGQDILALQEGRLNLAHKAHKTACIDAVNKAIGFTNISSDNAAIHATVDLFNKCGVEFGINASGEADYKDDLHRSIGEGIVVGGPATVLKLLRKGGVGIQPEGIKTHMRGLILGLDVVGELHTNLPLNGEKCAFFDANLDNKVAMLTKRTGLMFLLNEVSPYKELVASAQAFVPKEGCGFFGGYLKKQLLGHNEEEEEEEEPTEGGGASTATTTTTATSGGNGRGGGRGRGRGSAGGGSDGNSDGVPFRRVRTAEEQAKAARESQRSEDRRNTCKEQTLLCTRFYVEKILGMPIKKIDEFVVTEENEHTVTAALHKLVKKNHGFSGGKKLWGPAGAPPLSIQRKKGSCWQLAVVQIQLVLMTHLQKGTGITQRCVEPDTQEELPYPLIRCNPKKVKRHTETLLRDVQWDEGDMEEEEEGEEADASVSNGGGAPQRHSTPVLHAGGAHVSDDDDVEDDEEEELFDEAAAAEQERKEAEHEAEMEEKREQRTGAEAIIKDLMETQAALAVMTKVSYEQNRFMCMHREGMHMAEAVMTRLLINNRVRAERIVGGKLVVTLKGTSGTAAAAAEAAAGGRQRVEDVDQVGEDGEEEEVEETEEQQQVAEENETAADAAAMDEDTEDEPTARQLSAMRTPGVNPPLAPVDVTTAEDQVAMASGARSAARAAMHRMASASKRPRGGGEDGAASSSKRARGRDSS